MEKEYSLELDLHTFRKTFVYSSILAILGVVVSMGLTSCCRDGFVPRDGDLLFCIGGDSPMSDAITSSTSTSESVRYDHVAIFATLGGIPSVIEADPKYGVRVTDWEEFISQAQTVGGKPGIDVMRIQEDIDIDAAIGRALGFRGQGYDWYYLPSNGLMYCSELIYESFLRRDGTHVFTAIPMSFRDKDGNMPEFWTELFKGLEMDVPEGEPGTNPNDMSKDAALKPVHRYINQHQCPF